MDVKLTVKAISEPRKAKNGELFCVITTEKNTNVYLWEKDGISRSEFTVGAVRSVRITDGQYPKIVAILDDMPQTTKPVPNIHELNYKILQDHTVMLQQLISLLKELDVPRAKIDLVLKDLPVTDKVEDLPPLDGEIDPAKIDF